MMYCDFKTVTNALFDHVVKSSIKSFTTFINMLLVSFINEKKDSSFDTSQASKFKKGERIPSKDCVEYYKKKDRTALLVGISDINPMLADKETLHKFLYDLIIHDNTLSDEKRKATLEHHSQSYTDDTALADLICDALLLSMTRKYKKEQGEKDYHVVASAKVQESSACLTANDYSKLFANTEYVPPCEHFCGRDEELRELHDLVKRKSKVMVVGVRSIGKSELVRAFIEKYGSDYEHIGYYNYTIEQSNSVRPRSLWNIIYEINGTDVSFNNDDEFKKNLTLLSSLGRKGLLVIDSFNVPASYDKNLVDIRRLKCDVIMISYMNYDDMTVYKVRDFRRYNDAYALIQSYYPFNIRDAKIESEVHRLVLLSHRNPFILSVCGKYLMKGVATLDTITTALVRKDYRFMKARISTVKNGEFQEKANYHELLARVANLAELSETDMYVLSYMRFMPKFGVAKLLFVKVINLDDINVIENLIDLGFIQEDNGGTISLPSIVCDIVGSDIPLKPEEFAPFAKRFFELNLSDAPKNVLSNIANNISAARYIGMYESDRFMAAHMLYQFNYKIGDYVTMFMLITTLSMFRDPDDPIQTGIYNSDKSILYKELDKLKDGEMLKAMTDREDERFHSGIPLPRHRTIEVTENEDGTKTYRVIE